MIIKTPMQELIYVLDFFTEVYKGDKETIGSEFTKFVIKNLENITKRILLLSLVLPIIWYSSQY